MAGIAVAGLCLGTLADRLGRRRTIVIGLTAFAAACFLFAAGKTFLFFACCMGLSGLAIGVFKTGALALIGDISTSTAEHTSIMNTVEGFFGVGSIIGPADPARICWRAGVSWKWLYVIAGTMCVVLIVLGAVRDVSGRRRVQCRCLRARQRNRAPMKNPYVLAFSAGAFLYVGVEAAIYVWMPTLIAGYRRTRRHGWRPTASRSSSLLRAAGRFLGAWMLTRCRWQAVLAVFSGAFWLFRVERGRGREWAVYLLPAVGSVHVRHLSDAQFERHQLPAESTNTAPRPASFSSSPVSLRCSPRSRSARWATPTVRSRMASGSRRGSRRCCSPACS